MTTSTPATTSVPRQSRTSSQPLRHLPNPRTSADIGDIGDIVRAAAEGDEIAWYELVRRHSHMIWAVARSFRLADEDAADAVQNTWLRLATRLDTIQAPESLPGWLATTARNECRQLLRGRREHATLVEDLDRASDEPGPAEHAVSRDVSRLLSIALRRLPEREARLMSMLMQSSRPGYNEIADRLGMPVGSIGPTRSRVLERLRAELVASSITDLRG
jgi:RNA polymerase sigma factor (sigma-70 family)